MTITSGRAWAATATASRAELASAHTTTSAGVGQQQLDAVADDLVVVDQHDPQRWRAHGSIVAGLTGLAQAARRRRLEAHLGSYLLDHRRPVASSSAPAWSGDRRADPVEEVLDGRLGDPVQQHPVDRPPEGSQGWPVAGADGQLGPVLAQASRARCRPPGGGARPPARPAPRSGAARSWRGSGPAGHLDRDSPTEPQPGQGSDPDLGEQMVAAPLGLAGNRGQPVGRSVEHHVLDLPGRQGQLQVVANGRPT